jgi:large-conductance mechanosensitive channel
MVQRLTVSKINIQLIVNPRAGALFASTAANGIIQINNQQKMRYGNMLNKTVAFSVLAAAIVLIPTTVFAGEQYSEQITIQEGAALNNGTNIQRNSNISVQRQYKGATVNGRGICRNASSTQEQRSIQDSTQAGSAINSSRNIQKNDNVSTQRQVIVSRSTSCTR